MRKVGLDTIPIVSEDKRYVGITQGDTVIIGTVKDLYARYVQSCHYGCPVGTWIKFIF
jgi:hypothetical protein